MTHPASGNPTWQDYPNLATPVTAASLEAIESALDNNAASHTAPTRSGWAQSSATVPTAATVFPLTGLTAVSGMQDAPITVNGSGAFLLNEPGIWSLTYRAASDATVAHWTTIAISWPNGAWWPAVNDLTDKAIAASGFGGAGGLSQVLHWSGYVSPSVATTRPLTLTIAMSAVSVSGGCDYRFIAEHRRL